MYSCTTAASATIISTYYNYKPLIYLSNHAKALLLLLKHLSLPRKHEDPSSHVLSTASGHSRNPSGVPHIHNLHIHYDIQKVLHYCVDQILVTVTRRMVSAIPTEHKRLPLHYLPNFIFHALPQFLDCWESMERLHPVKCGF